jgi:hypothetical protein
VNFGNGIRLLGSNLAVYSKEGHGKYFDELLLNTQGLGNDPYQYSNLRVQKNRLYRYDFLWRQNAYYNPAIPITFGEHAMDTVRALQDHSLTLLPQSPVKIFAGYSRNSQSGPALSTIQIFDVRGDEFPLFSNVRRLQNEVRLGAEANFAGFKLSVLRAWEFFKDDTEQSVSGTIPGNNTLDDTVLNSFRRSEPYHGTTKNWRVQLLGERYKLWAVNGRFTYAEGRRDFIFDESLAGIDRFAAARNRQSLMFGDARRPVSQGNLTLSLFPADKITVVNHTSFHNTRIDGDGSYSELNNGTLSFTSLNFQLLGIRTIANSTDVNYQSGWIGLGAGYQYSTRRIRSVEQAAFGDVPDRIEAEQENTLHAGRFSLRLRPSKPFSLLVDAEIGRADRPIYPTSERNYHGLGGRVQHKTRKLTVSASTRINYNFNSVSLAAYSSRSRTYSADASWTPRTNFSLDASYSKLHLDTMSALAYFAANRLISNDRSIYVSNIHAAHLSARFSPVSKIDLFIGFSHIQDTGSSRAPVAYPARPVVFDPGVTTLAYQTYPLSFTSPYGRFSLRLHPKLRWNLGYQHYRYSEDILSIQNYRAHTGFTSLTWSF